MDLNEYQSLALRTVQTPVASTSADIVPLLGLAGEVGELLSEHKKYLRDGSAHKLFKSRIEEELGDILWYIAAVGSRFDISLDRIAQRNIEKCASNWGPQESAPSVFNRFDADFPPHEQFPQKFRINFEEVLEGDVLKVQATWNGVQMGQTLTNNAEIDDGYRFHDVFHLACVAGLGWSPVTRRNLKLKRKSDLKVDENEDGGRAIVIEEGVTALVFSYANEHDWLRGVDRVDHDVLKMIKKMTAHLEVSECTIAEWEATVLMAYPVWVSVVQNRGGSVELDLANRLIEFIA